MEHTTQVLPQPGTVHQQLGVFIGTWETTGQTAATGDSPAQAVQATDTYEWLPGKFFVIHTVDAQIGEASVKLIEVIGYDNEKKNYFMHAYDNTGTVGTMEGRLDEKGDWYFTGPTERATLVINDENTMTAEWEHSPDGTNWQPLMSIRLVRK